MTRINSEKYIYKGFSVYQESVDGRRGWTAYDGMKHLFWVEFDEFDRIQPILDMWY